jgi:hypothetical protein
VRRPGARIASGSPAWLRVIIAAAQQQGPQPGNARRIELHVDVREEQDVLRFSAQRRRDLPVTVGLALVPDLRVEVRGKQRAEIACFAVAEQQPLGVDRAGREHRQCSSIGVPAA